jgi:hypothetical protein
MKAYTSDFSLKVEGVKGLCPAGEAWATERGHREAGGQLHRSSFIDAPVDKGRGQERGDGGCFLKCRGRVLKELVGEEHMIHIDALPLYKKYTDIFLMDDVPEDERKAVARQVADKIVAKLKQQGALTAIAA